MKQSARLLIGFVLIALMGSMTVFLLAHETQSPLGASFSQAFTLLGRGTKTADRIISQSLPLNDEDEARLGEMFEDKIKFWQVKDHRCAEPIDDLLQQLAQTAHRKLVIKSFIISGEPNAMAFPGGLVAVTDKLLNAIGTEAQRSAILAHELGHIELRHTFDAVKYEMATRQLNIHNLGSIFDSLSSFFIQHSFSKTQEAEADQYAFELLIKHGYPAEALSESFVSLMVGRQNYQRSSLLRDYFSSHPPLPLRIENYREKARAYRTQHPEPAPKADSHYSEGCENL